MVCRLLMLYILQIPSRIFEILAIRAPRSWRLSRSILPRTPLINATLLLFTAIISECAILLPMLVRRALPLKLLSRSPRLHSFSLNCCLCCLWALIVSIVVECHLVSVRMMWWLLRVWQSSHWLREIRERQGLVVFACFSCGCGALWSVFGGRCGVVFVDYVVVVVWKDSCLLIWSESRRKLRWSKSLHLL